MKKKSPYDKFGAGLGTLQTYIFGFGLSLLLTIGSYLMVLRHVNSQHVIYSDQFLLFATASLAVIQLFVQLVFFLHLGHGSNSRWNLLVASLAIMVVFIVVFGSIWIMGNLNYHHDQSMSPSQIDQGIIQNEAVHHY